MDANLPSAAELLTAAQRGQFEQLSFDEVSLRLGRVALKVLPLAGMLGHPTGDCILLARRPIE